MFKRMLSFGQQPFVYVFLFSGGAAPPFKLAWSPEIKGTPSIRYNENSLCITKTILQIQQEQFMHNENNPSDTTHILDRHYMCSYMHMSLYLSNMIVVSEGFVVVMHCLFLLHPKDCFRYAWAIIVVSEGLWLLCINYSCCIWWNVLI